MADYIKSPLNYVGGKYNILSEIVPEFPNQVKTFYDVFAGGFNVGINVRADKIVYNDIIPYIKELFGNLNNNEVDVILKEIDKIITTYKLDRENKDGFLQLRDDYNDIRNWLLFYVLTCYSFNNQYRFNNKHQYNSSFGKRCFNDKIKNNLIQFMSKLHSSNVEFWNENYKNIDWKSIHKDDFVFFDPPYLITTGNYNDGKRGFEGWSVDDEIELYKICDKLNNDGIKFGLTNVTHHKGKTNNILIDWYERNRYNTKELNNGFKKSYNSKNDGMTREIYISNY